MKKTIIYTSIVVAVVIFSLIVHYKDKVLTKEQHIVKLEGEINTLKSKVMQLIETNEYHLADTLTVYNTKWDTTNIPEITEGGARIGLYIDKYQCEPCWEEELMFLERTFKKTKGMEKPFVLAENFSQRELVLLGKKNTTALPIYGIENQPQLERITKYRLPFYFVLNAKGVISSVFFPDKGFNMVDSIYFASIIKQCKSEKMTSNIPHKKTSQAAIEIQNPLVDLGEVGMRKKSVATFKIRNNSKKKCTIFNVSLTCSCTLLESAPQIMLPGEEGEIKIAFLSPSKGEFSRSVIIHTDMEPSTYTLTLKGKVV